MASHRIRAGDQRQKRQGARPHHFSGRPLHRRRGDRMIGRREFIALLGGAAATWPIAVRAQQAAMPVVGYLSPTSPIGAGQTALTAIRRGLRDNGFVEGQNVAVEYRWAEGQLDRLPALAAELVRRHVSVIATSGGLTSARAARAATSTIPIVFLTASDPVQL